MSAAATSLDTLVNALLYEGYVLYPYRASSRKNRQRWSFGTLHPKSHCLEQAASRAWRLQAQCLAEGDLYSVVNSQACFLQPVQRQMFARDPSGVDHPVEWLEVEGQAFYTWQEMIERRVSTPPTCIGDLVSAGCRVSFAYDPAIDREVLRDSAGHSVGSLTRTRRQVCGVLSLRAEPVGSETFRMTACVENLTALDTRTGIGQEAADARAFASAHIVLLISGGAFVSLLDAPAALSRAADDCHHIGCYPVLVGEAPDRSTLLAAPIILYDYPRVAPESPGDFFDGTEIDEMLMLRILSMTDDEKREMAALDDRTRRLLELTQNLAEPSVARLHGRWRTAPTHTDAGRGAYADHGQPDTPVAGPRLSALKIGDLDISVNQRVRLKPRAGGDIMDIALTGRTATIESIERDFEDRVHVAVTLDEDPGRDLGIARLPAHRFFFSPEELEPLP